MSICVRFAVLLVSVPVALAGCASVVGRPTTARGAATGPAVRVLTYNVNYGNPGDEATIAALLSTDADAIFLQETNAAWEAALRARTERKYPYQVHVDDAAAGGSAVLSKHPLLASELYDPPEGGWFRAMRVVLDSPIGPLQVLSVHLRPQLGDDGSVVSGYLSTGPIRHAEMARYHGALDASLPTLVVGDFNERGGDAIRYLEARGYRSGLADFAGRRDTWRWNTSMGEVRSELDHVEYSTATLVPREVRVIERGHSDHFPVLGVFERRL